MIYMGIVSDKVYHDGSITHEEKTKDRYQFKFNDWIKIRRCNDVRVFSDEVKMAYGFPALSQMARCFKNRHYVAWRAWKRLV